jgi:hypothetical protein
MQLHLRKFDMASVASDVVIIIGRHATGKSLLVWDLLYHHRDIPHGTVVSSREHPPDLPIGLTVASHAEYQPRIVEQVVRRQQQARRRVQVPDIRTFLVLDSCLFDANDRNIRCLFMNGRCIRCLLVLTMEYPMGLCPSLRTNIDYTFILREDAVETRRRIYDLYAGLFPTFDIFCQIMDQCTNDDECLVIHNSCHSYRLEDQVFWYRAEPRAGQVEELTTPPRSCRHRTDAFSHRARAPVAPTPLPP